MLEKMDVFFENKLSSYDEHMLSAIEGAKEFYPFTASLLPMKECRVLDLGCGTGLELEEFFRMNPNASVTGIDLSAGMLEVLKKKFPDKRLTLINGSYFDEPLGEEAFDAAVSVESLHHFEKAQKAKLYSRLYRALKPDGYFILTDYFVPDDIIEAETFAQFTHLKAEQGIDNEGFYHFDTPLTLLHEIEALIEGGFSNVEVMNSWGGTTTIRAKKEK